MYSSLSRYLPVVDSQRRDFPGLHPCLLALEWDALSAGLRDRLVATKVVVPLNAGRRTIEVIVKSLFPSDEHAALNELWAGAGTLGTPGKVPKRGNWPSH